MEKELDTIVKATQASLGKYVKRPPLTEKLLKKPPFRFLHDIVTSVLKSTGFFENLFDEEELISDNVKDRESKIAFLNKVITIVGLTTGKTVSAKPSKIVAGQEPDKTNELLQYLAQALDKNLSSADAVTNFKQGTNLAKPGDKKSKDASRPTKKTSENKKLTSKSNDKLIPHKKESTVQKTKESIKSDNDKSNQKKKEKTATKIDSPPKKLVQQTKPIPKKPSIEKPEMMNKKTDVFSNSEVINDSNNENMESIKSNLSLSTDGSSLPDPYTNLGEAKIEDPALSSQDTETNSENNEIVGTNLFSNLVEINSREGSSNVGIVNKHNNEIPNTTSENLIEEPNIKPKEEEKQNIDVEVIKSPIKVRNVRPVSVRPSSSRPGAPRPREKHDNILPESENILVGKVNIITESAQNEEEEDTSIIVVDQEYPKSAHDEQEQLQASSNQHGHLVQQILDSQKEYSQISGMTEIEWEFGAQKSRDALSKEIEKLRYDIQGLSRVANPLGKLLDHIQEDVEVMRQELLQWTKIYEETSKELSKQKAANEDSLLPLRTKVKQLRADIVERREKTNDLKIIIHKNASRIDKLLSNGNMQ